MKRIFLMGYMGAGKTTVGKDLAKLAELSFIDLDKHIEARYCRSVNRIFEELGEEEFRRIEQRMLHEVAAFENVVISTGGGVPCFFDNMVFMKKSGLTVYLKATADELAKRLETCKQTRPVLQGKTGESLKRFIAESLNTRERFYNQADIIVDAEVMLTTADVCTLSAELKRIITETLTR
jgi:shikimate kinase